MCGLYMERVLSDAVKRSYEYHANRYIYEMYEEIVDIGHIVQHFRFNWDFGEDFDKIHMRNFMYPLVPINK